MNITKYLKHHFCVKNKHSLWTQLLQVNDNVLKLCTKIICITFFLQRHMKDFFYRQQLFEVLFVKYCILSQFLTIISDFPYYEKIVLYGLLFSRLEPINVMSLGLLMFKITHSFILYRI